MADTVEPDRLDPVGRRRINNCPAGHDAISSCSHDQYRGPDRPDASRDQQLVLDQRRFPTKTIRVANRGRSIQPYEEVSWSKRKGSTCDDPQGIQRSVACQRSQDAP